MLKDGAVGSWVLAAGWVALLAGCGSDNGGSGGNGSTPPSLVLEGDFTVMTPDDLAALKGATEITGSLVIQGQTITTLPGLDSLRSVGVDLRIMQTALADLKGLKSLAHVEGFLWIESNLSLHDLSGLETLKTTGWTTAVKGNFELLSLDGLDNLKSVEGQLVITDNVKLASITALSRLEALGDNLNVFNNFSVPQCEVDDLRQRLTAKGWTGTATINGLKACAGTCSGPVCMP
jgi:hypothetical protein